MPPSPAQCPPPCPAAPLPPPPRQGAPLGASRARPPMVVLLFLLLATTATVTSQLIPLPRAHVHERLTLPLRGTDPTSPTTHRLILVADTDHTVSRSARSICQQIGTAFDAGNFSTIACPPRISASLRAARGLSIQHDPDFSAAVAALDSYLGEEGHSESDWEGFSEVWHRPYKARFLQGLVKKALGALESGEECNVCAVGFGTGHTALLLLTAAASAAGTPPSTPTLRVYSFDRATARAAIPAQDFLDVRFPDRHFLFLGDPPLAMGRFITAFPTTKCHIMLLDPNGLQTLGGNATAQALRALLPMGVPGGVLALVSSQGHWEGGSSGRRRKKEGGGGGGREDTTHDDLTSTVPTGGGGSGGGGGGGAGAGAGVDGRGAGVASPGEVWKQAEKGGWINWEGTLVESMDRPGGDSVMYGYFTGGVGGAPRLNGVLPVEEFGV